MVDFGIQRIELFLLLSAQREGFRSLLFDYFRTYWKYKLVRSVFLCIYFKTKWMNRSLKVLSIAAYYFFPSLKQFFRILFRKNDSSLEAIQFWSQFSISAKEVNQWLAVSFGTTSNQKEQYPESTAGAIKHSISKYFFTTLATWSRALWRRITLSCLCSYFDRFSRNAAQTNQL